MVCEVVSDKPVSGDRARPVLPGGKGDVGAHSEGSGAQGPVQA